MGDWGKEGEGEHGGGDGSEKFGHEIRVVSSYDTGRAIFLAEYVSIIQCYCLEGRY